MHYARSVTVSAPARELFAWHERPGAFERLVPPWQRVQVVRSDGRITDGARVELRTWLPPGLPLRVPVRWLIEHRDYVAGRQFRDMQLAGPFARWSHLHRVDPGGAGGAESPGAESPGAESPGAESPNVSTLTDAVDFDLPLGSSGAFAGGALARRELDRLFRYRHAVTAADLERHAAAALPLLTVAVTGASGLVGRALTSFLTAGGHTVVRVGRGEAPGHTPPSPHLRDVRWDPDAGRLDPRALEGVDAVVHLAGANVGDRWTSAHKAAVRDSRVRSTRLVAHTIAELARHGHAPRVLVSMSAVGFYGDRGDEVLDEQAPRGRGFLADVAAAWEDAADAARAAGVRVVHPRLGVVLTPEGGALPKLMRPFQVGAGGAVSGGRQWMSLISLDDTVGALHWLLAGERHAGGPLDGPVHLVLPAPVTNAEFARTLGHVLHRPARVPTPAFALRLALGREQADEMVLASQRAVPTRLLASGFAFRHPTLDDTLRFELGR